MLRTKLLIKLTCSCSRNKKRRHKPHRMTVIATAAVSLDQIPCVSSRTTENGLVQFVHWSSLEEPICDGN